MGQDLFDGHAFARDRFAEAAEVLGFDIADIMFNGSDEDLKQTKSRSPRSSCTPSFWRKASATVSNRTSSPATAWGNSAPSWLQAACSSPTA